MLAVRTVCGGAARVHRVELGAHEAGEHDDAAQDRAAPSSPRRLVEARQAFVTELCGQDLALLRSEGEERGPPGLDVARGEGAIERGEARTISIARHRRRLLPARDGVNRGSVSTHARAEYAFPSRSVEPLRP